MSKDKLQFLSKVADVLTKEVDTSELALELKTLLNEFAKINDLKLYVYDNVTNTMCDCVDSWSIVEDNSDIYELYESLKGQDFVINSKAYKLPAVISDITLKINSLCMPIVKDGKDFGVIKDFIKSIF